MRFYIDRVSFPSLIILCAFLLTEGAHLHRQSFIPVTDRPLRVLLIARAYLYYAALFVLPTMSLLLFLLVGVWFSHMTGDHSMTYMFIGGMHHMRHACLHRFTGCIPNTLLGGMRQPHVFSLH